MTNRQVKIKTLHPRKRILLKEFWSSFEDFGAGLSIIIAGLFALRYDVLKSYDDGH